MKTLLLTLVVLCLQPCSGIAQCNYFPGDCPETGDIEAAQDSSVNIANLLIPPEIVMQNSVRNILVKMMDQIAQQNKWTFYEYTEQSGGGQGTGGIATPYNLRRPHSYMISFAFVVNEDSLNAWREWYNKDLQNASNKAVSSYKKAGDVASTDQVRENNQDSAMFYTNLKGKFMTDHAAEYQTAILSGDNKGQKKYESESKKFDDKISAFINKLSDQTTSAYASSEKQFSDLENYKHRNMIAFRSGSLLRVTFNVNTDMVLADDGDKKIRRQLSFSGATLALLLHNEKPEDREIFEQYYRATDLVLLLFGKWQTVKDQDHNYHASFSVDKRNTDVRTPKLVSSDKVQTMALHVEGGWKYADRFLHSLPFDDVNRLIFKN